MQAKQQNNRPPLPRTHPHTKKATTTAGRISTAPAAVLDGTTHNKACSACVRSSSCAMRLKVTHVPGAKAKRLPKIPLCHPLVLKC